MPIPLIMTVDFFKGHGKWVATAKIPTTDREIRELKEADEFGFNAVCDFIREKQEELSSTSEYYWAVSVAAVAPCDEKDVHEFCRFLRKP